MEIEVDFQKTEVGIIPSDWEVKNILQNSTMKARIGWQGLTVAEYLDNGDYFLITGTDFVDRKIKWETCHFVDKERYSQDKNIQLKEGDILITKDGTIGKVAYVDNLPLNATLNSGVFVIRPKDNSYVPLYLFYVFNSAFFRNFLNKLVAGSTINHLYQKDFVSFDFPLPPTKAEQTAIATTLNDADALISQLEKLIAKKRNIKQGAMQELLKPKDGWVIEPLGKYVKISSGESPSKFEFKDYGIPYFKVEQLNNSEKYVFETPFHISSNVTISKGSIIFPKRGASIFLNKIRILKEDSYMDTNLMTLTVSEELNNEFLFYQLSHIRLDKIADTTSIPQINNKHINPFLIPLPATKNEQMKIIEILSDMDTEIDTLEKKLEKYKSIKQGMMQNLLTGKIRLI